MHSFFSRMALVEIWTAMKIAAFGFWWAGHARQRRAGYLSGMKGQKDE